MSNEMGPLGGKIEKKRNTFYLEDIPKMNQTNI